MISIDQACEIMQWGLAQQSPRNDGKTIQVKRVYLMNNTMVVCEFYPRKATSIEIKSEMSYIVVFLYGFFKDNPHTPKNIQSFGIRAFSQEDEELMYAVSSVETASLMSQGKTIEWLRNTIFQDNSDDNRMALAKKRISHIENALRRLVSNVLFDKKGSSWWDECVNSSIKNEAERAYRNQKRGALLLGEELIYYTYLLQLKKIILENWLYFDSIFLDKTGFNDCIEDLNVIRRDEAHNRNISASNIKKLNQIYTDILARIAAIYPDVVPGYMVENWRDRLKEVVEEHSINQLRLDPGKTYDLVGMVANIEIIIAQHADVETRLLSIPVPIGKSDLHNDLVAIYREKRLALSDMIQNVRNGNMQGLTEAAARDEETGKKIKVFLEKYLMSEL